MADLLPSTPDTSTASEADPRVIGLDSEDADEALAALSSDTARTVLGELHDEPAPPSALADRVDTSLQNVQYHLEKLQDAGLVDVVDTAYSEKGREMRVYAPADKPLVVFAGREEERTGIRAALKRLLGGVALVGVASILVQAVLGELPLPFGATAGGESVSMSAETGGTAEQAAGLPPGLLFFLGGVAVLLVGFVGWYGRRWLAERR